MKTSDITRIIFGGLTLCLLSSCSNPLGGNASFVDAGYGPGASSPESPVIPAATGFEAVSGSAMRSPSTGATHKADVTVGAPTNEIRLTTTGNKIVYLSVQGQLVSDP